nr:DUF4147 domain-containing protein [uncultured Oscillibacter sp.]
MTELLRHAEEIYGAAIRRALPDAAVKEALKAFRPGPGRTLLVSVGKAAWRMAAAALEAVDADGGLVVTKYGHSQGPLPGLEILEAGHPVADAASFTAAERALALVRGLGEEDSVLFLLSGGGSALFESSDLPQEEFQEINRRLLACGADIQEVNRIRKRLSNVKGGRFGAACAPARVFSVVLSDVLGDRLDMIASGPAAVDASTLEETLAVVEKYHLELSPKAHGLLERSLPPALPHVESCICGSVSQLCRTAAEVCRELGYEVRILTDRAEGEARETGEALAQALLRERKAGRPLALILGGETVVKLTGGGKGGRNQELALAAAPILAGTEGTALFSVGSDGTDGPTDAAGGYVDGGTRDRLRALGIEIPAVLAENDSYHALEKIGGLIVTGPTGTNVNDLSVGLYWPPDMP